MPLPQILRSRAQFAVPLLRQSIRASEIRQRCFVTTLPRRQEPEIPATNSEDSTTQHENPQLAAESSPVESPPMKRYSRVVTVRRVIARPRLMITSVDTPPVVRDTLQAPIGEDRIRQPNHGYSIVPISTLMATLRDPAVLPTGPLLIRKISIFAKDEELLTEETIKVDFEDIFNERKARHAPAPDSTAQSPIMAKLGITSIEQDRCRYIVTNLREIGLAAMNPLDPLKAPKVNDWKKLEYLAGRRVAENMDIFLRTPAGGRVILEGEGNILRSRPWDAALTSTIAQIKFLTLAMREAMGFRHPNETNKYLPWDPDEYKSTVRLFTRAENRVARFMDKTSTGEEFNEELIVWAGNVGEETTSATDVEESAVNTTDVGESPTQATDVEGSTPAGDTKKPISKRSIALLEEYTKDLESALNMTKSLIDTIEDGNPDADKMAIRKIRKFEMRLRKNIEAIRTAQSESDLVPIVTMDGKRFTKRADGIHVATFQISRITHSIYDILCNMGFYPNIDGLHSNGLRSPMPTGPTTGSPRIRRSYIKPWAAISSSRREYSTKSRGFPNRPPPTFGTQKPRRHPAFETNFKPDVGAGFRRIFKMQEPVPQKPEPEPGHSVRDKMMAKEKERLKAREGLSYSLLSMDQQQGGGSSVQKVVETDNFRNVGSWEGGGGLTDESGVQPLKKGDMCEIRSGGGSQLGIYLRPSLFGEPTSDFLVMSGEISLAQTPRISFSIPSFIPEGEVTKLLSHYDQILAASGFGPSERSQLVLPRSVMTSILEKVREFSTAAARLYAEQRTRFDELYEQLAHQDRPSTITLFEAAEEIFGSKYGDRELYATHLALMGDGSKYMTDKAAHRATNTFTVRSKDDVAMIDFVTQHVRKTTSKDGILKKKRRDGEQNRGRKEQLDSFLEKAKMLIDLSREYKAEDLVAKQKGGAPVRSVEVEDVSWDKNDKFFIDFVKASMMQSGSQATPMSGLVPSILRATGKYEGELDAVVAYQFLSEIGAWSPWENLALRQNNITFPGFGTSKVTDEDQTEVAKIDTPAAVEKMELKDCMKEVRKDWGQMEVYCIDDAAAHEIDDGFSLERVSDAESWIHVHIANPTAFLPQNHWLSDVAFRRKQSVYLPERTYPMLPVSFTDKTGMGPDRGVMTISAKVNKEGDIVDLNVQAGFVRNVKRFTYEAVSKALGRPNKKMVTYQAGEFPKPTSNTPEPTFTEKQLADFNTLSELALAFRRRRVRDQMVECISPSYDVAVYDGLNSPIHPADTRKPLLYRGHPSIRISVDTERHYGLSNFIVSEIMQLANHITAKFCRANNIAAPFRSMEYDHERSDLVNHFRSQILPLRNELGHLDHLVGLRYMMFLGQTHLSATPKPHRLLGFEDGYVRATSPLRRYSDMIAHWQIQAHLLGRKPRTHRQLANIIPEMDRGERIAQFTGKDSRRFWGTVGVGRILETDRSLFPKELEFLVMEKQMYPTLSVGLVTDLGMAGKVKFNSKAEEMSVEAGDILRVTPDVAKPGEKFVWYNCQGVLRKTGKIMQ